MKMILKLIALKKNISDILNSYHTKRIRIKNHSRQFKMGITKLWSVLGGEQKAFVDVFSKRSWIVTISLF